MNKLSVIIPTLLKNKEILKKLLLQLQNDEAVNEIILIDNSRNGFKLNIPKLRVFIPGKKEKLYVNQSWNLGIKEAKGYFYALFNDDLIVCDNFCSKVMELVEKAPNFGCLGMASTSVINTDFNDIPEISEFSIEMNNSEREYNWGTIIFGKKDEYINIPEKIKIWCGDDFIRYCVKKENKNIYELKNAKIYHLGGLSSRNSKFNRIKYRDVIEFGKINIDYKKNEAYTTATNYYSTKNKIKKIIALFVGKN